MVIAWLVNTMLPTIGKTYLFLIAIKEDQEVVKKTYLDDEDSSQIFETKSRLWKMRQGEREVADYYIKMLSLARVGMCLEEE